MRITLQSGADLIPLAGEDGVSDRVHSAAEDFEVTATAEVQILRRVRAEHAIPIDRGNLATSVSFGTRRVFETPAEAFQFCEDYDAGNPRTGALVFDTGAGKRKLMDAVVSPPKLRAIGAAAYLAYVAMGTEIKPAEPEIIIPRDLGSGVLFRIVDDGNEKWMEFGFLSPTNDLIGDAVNGWTDAGGNLLFRFHRSENLVDWDHDFIAAPSSPEAVGDGDYRYWARCKYPVDSKVKTGQLWCESPTAAYGSSDTRNNPFTALTVNNVVRALGGFPYTMPGDAARMQADMRANGLTDATVVATSATNWRIDIPNVYQTAYQAVTKVFWPTYLVADMFGVVNTPVDGWTFIGQFVNTAGVRTNVQKQFARLAVSPGPNYQY